LTRPNTPGLVRRTLLHAAPSAFLAVLALTVAARASGASPEDVLQRGRTPIGIPADASARRAAGATLDAESQAAVSVITNGTISVTTTTDEFGSGAACSLREAIQSANTNTNFGGCTRIGSAPFQINVPAGTYTLTIPGNNEQANATGDLDVLATMAIVGSNGNPAG
jgi:CSLREA domain-containing protein